MPDLLVRAILCLAPTCFPEVCDTAVVHWEKSNGSTVFRAHIGDGGTVSYGQLGHSRTKELYKLAHDSNLSQMLKKNMIMENKCGVTLVTCSYM